VAAEEGPADGGGEPEGGDGAEDGLDDEGGGDGAVLLGVDEAGEYRDREDPGAELDGGGDCVDLAAAKDAADVVAVGARGRLVVVLLPRLVHRIGSMILDPLATEPETSESAAARVWGVCRRYPELALLAALLLLTATFSREFSKGASIGPIYVTEVVMVLSAAIAVLRHGIGESWRLLRRLPLPALAVIWLVGAIATLRGLSDYSLGFVENDIGLVDYTLILPLLALVVADRERHEALSLTLVACGFCGLVAFGLAYVADQATGEANTLITLQGSAAGLYMSLAVVWIAARWVNGVEMPWWLLALAPLGLVLMGLTTQRSVWMIAIASLAVVGLMAPRRRMRAGLALAGVVVVSLVAATGVQAVLNATTGGVEASGGSGDNFATKSEGEGSQLEQEIAGLGGGDSSEGQNVSWRLAYWGELISRVPDAPVLGVGFGEPAAFTWNGRKYDFRDGDPETGIDVAGPHNSFVNFLYRLGIPAFLALLFVVFVAVRNVWRALRDGVEGGERVMLTTLTGMLAAGAMASSFNEGLTGPFLGLFFWVPLGMLLLWPFTRARGSAAPAR
jgi:O-antigen ligase